MENKDSEISPQAINTEQQIQQPIREKTENKPPIRTNWGFLAVVVVFAILAVGGILLLQTRTPAPPIPNPAAQQVPPPAPSLQPQALDTNTWQTYRNEEFGFEVKYPPKLVISGDLNDAVFFRDVYGNVLMQMSLVPKGIECHPDAPEGQCRVVYTEGGVEVTFRYFGIASDEGTIELSPQRALYSFVRCKNDGERSSNQGVSFCTPLLERQIFEQILSTFRFIP